MADSKKKPDFDVMISKSVEKDGEKKNYYTTIGAGWTVQKGGISLSLDCLPLEGKMVLFPRTEKGKVETTESEAVAS